MFVDLLHLMIEATVQIDQPVNESKRMVGTGFLVAVPRSDGSDEIVLITAAHVFDKMLAPQVRIGWRAKNDKGEWVYAPSSLTIRTEAGPVWTRHPTQDIAVLSITVPPASAAKAIPLSLLADETVFGSNQISIGDEVQTLGYPHGLSANVQGFPILRFGRVASYPIGPSSSQPTFLVDLTAVPGNSGGPVFVGDSQAHKGFVAGVLIKQVEDSKERLELGVVADSSYVRKTIMINRLRPSSASASASKPIDPKLLGQSSLRTTDQGAGRDMVKGETAGQAGKPSAAIQSVDEAGRPVTPQDQ